MISHLESYTLLRVSAVIADPRSDGPFDLSVHTHRFVVRWNSLPPGFRYFYASVSTRGSIGRNIKLDSEAKKLVFPIHRQCSLIKLEILGIKQPYEVVQLGYINSSQSKLVNVIWIF